MNQTWYRWKDDNLTLRVRVQARARHRGITGVKADVLRVRLSAPPVDGKANEQLVELLAGAFAVPRGRVRILAGARSASKTLIIESPQRMPAELKDVLRRPAPRAP